MASSDAERWNQRYHRKDPGYQPHPQEFLLKHADLLPERGRALDIAMGLGGSAGYLAQHGLSVIGVDIAGVAVRRVKEHFPGLQAFIADLDLLWLPEKHFDLIVNYYYLERRIWPTISQALKPGGLFYIETFQKSAVGDNGMNPDYLLEPDELISAFPDLNTIIYEVKSTPGRGGVLQKAAGLVAQKPY